MPWKKLLAYVTGSVDEELLLRNEYLVAVGVHRFFGPSATDQHTETSEVIMHATLTNARDSNGHKACTSGVEEAREACLVERHLDRSGLHGRDRGGGRREHRFDDSLLSRG